MKFLSIKHHASAWGILLLLSSCATNSNISIPPYQQFVLGESEQAGFSVTLANLSNLPLDIETRDQQGQKTSGFGFAPKGKTKLGVSPQEKAIIRNPNGNKVVVKAKISRAVEGMRYEAASQRDVSITPSISDQDLVPMIASDWKGTLTYMDYSSNKKVNIPCNLGVEKVKANSYKFSYTFPNEPQANSSAKVNLSQDGQLIDGQRITSVDKQDNGTLVIKTFSEGKDNGKKAVLFYTYTLGERIFSVKKEYQTMGSSELQFRNIFSFSK